MAVADEQLAGHEAIADPAAVVRALVGDNHDLAALEPGDRDRTHTVPRRDDATDRDIDGNIEVRELRHPVIGVVTELVEQLGVEDSHGTTLRRGSDTPPDAM